MQNSRHNRVFPIKKRDVIMQVCKFSKPRDIGKRHATGEWKVDIQEMNLLYSRSFRDRVNNKGKVRESTFSSSPVTQIIQSLTRRHLEIPGFLHLVVIGPEEALGLLEHLLLPLLLHLALVR